MDYNCIVIGGGHAGIEASLAASRLGMKTLMITQNPDRIGSLSCNPAVGGLSKGNLVREVDALGGEMALLIDQTMIQYRVLNRSRGSAVQAPRAQADKLAYQNAARRSIETCRGLEIMMDTVTELIIEEKSGAAKRVAGVRTARGHEIGATAVVLAAGTFMEGKIFIGEYDAPQGRLGEEAALGLGNFLRRRGFVVGRLKTGTPARVDGSTVDYRKMERQDGETAAPFSFGWDSENTPFPSRPNIPCWITYTNPKTHGIISANIHRSPLYGGKIQGAGPRYCPSIEDKVMRFPNRDRHHVFVEPEGLYTNEMYLNGLSSSLPEDVQELFIRSIPGLEEARIVRPAYAVEYDYLDPLDLFPSLESKHLEGFFSAGQTNGSSGYEEAAAQGIMAGINAALKTQGKEALVLGREEAYIGVLIDDLTTLGTAEPYRMFTSRAEHRLLLRHDTADRRLTPKGRALGLVRDERWEGFTKKLAALDTIRELLERREFPKTEDDQTGQGLEAFPPEWVMGVSLDNKYAGYIEKEKRIIGRNAKMERVKLDPGADYGRMQGLSAEAREKLAKVRPRTVAQAARIPGVRQGDVALLMVLARRAAKTRNTS
ncbi:MAG: tRNA uridine-5-carboxymethylaminomethyl(34) synthesis enzyme MnmG [Spirochaetaceae bacterium]|jgi:tRNA uridine 5-carboxymethylaminomethyl modification enzyme|nr:tRNA uridine-5-carboxymethylaminomethyl(34) synthesis enzyme MnmG [Spirochaetaceae bacterium]